MHRKIAALTVTIVIMSLISGCSAPASSPEVVTTASVVTHSPETYADNSSAAETTETTTTAEQDVKIDLTGYYLDDAIRIINKCGVDSAYIEYFSDNGKSIIVKNNWVVIGQTVNNRRIYLECTKGRSDGILDSIKEVGKNAVSFITEVEANADKIRNASEDIDYVLDHFR